MRGPFAPLEAVQVKFTYEFPGEAVKLVGAKRAGVGVGVAEAHIGAEDKTQPLSGTGK